MWAICLGLTILVCAGLLKYWSQCEQELWRFKSVRNCESLLIDTTEQSIERPKKVQKPYYSGKKKRHTLKTEIRTTRQGRIVHVSKTHPGSVHDFTVFKGEKRPAKESRVYLDSGYQGIAAPHPNADFRYKCLQHGAFKGARQGRSHLCTDQNLQNFVTPLSQQRQALRHKIQHHRRHREPQKWLFRCITLIRKSLNPTKKDKKSEGQKITYAAGLMRTTIKVMAELNKE